MSGLCIKTLFYLFICLTVDSNFTEISLETCVNAQSDGVVTRQGWLGWLGRAGHKDRTLSTVGGEEVVEGALKTTALSN